MCAVRLAVAPVRNRLVHSEQAVERRRMSAGVAELRAGRFWRSEESKVSRKIVNVVVNVECFHLPTVV